MLLFYVIIIFFNLINGVGDVKLSLQSVASVEFYINKFNRVDC